MMLTERLRKSFRSEEFQEWGSSLPYRERSHLKMRIVVLEGSPNRHGSSNMLADEFIRGAKEAGHTIKVIDAAHADLHPCTGCVC